MNSNILKQEIVYLKQKMIHRDKTIKQKDSQSYKLQTAMSALKKDLSTSRAYAIKLENGFGLRY
jgi:type II secretory pathway component PulJ